MNDPIVAEVRKFRDEHAGSFNYDLDAICSALMASQRHSGHPLVNRSAIFNRVCEDSVEYKARSDKKP